MTFMNPDQRGSRTFVTAVLLTLTGGYLDAYTYFVRGKVFANAQTGNIIKLGIFAAQGDFHRCLDFLFPILAFCLGVMCSLAIEEYFEGHKKPYSRRGVLLVEILCMIVIAFLPNTEFFDVLSNILVSFLCAMQMQTFQIFHKKVIATTVGTGNLRKGVESLYRSIRKKRCHPRYTGIGSSFDPCDPCTGMYAAGSSPAHYDRLPPVSQRTGMKKPRGDRGVVFIWQLLSFWQVLFSLPELSSFRPVPVH